MDGNNLTDNPLVGREQELASIREVISSAADEGRGSALFLVGAPGVGKSRLLREAIDTASATGLFVVRARCTQDRSALQPLQEAMLAITRDRPLLDDPRLESFVPTLTWLTSGPRVTDGYSMLVLGEALLRALAIAGHDVPVLLTIEDIHWADPETVTVVDYLIDHAAQQRLVVMATTRQEPGPGTELARSVEARRAGRSVEIHPLTFEETVELAAECLEAPLPAEMEEALCERTEGVPFLVEEVVAAAVIDEVLQHHEEGWVYTGGLDDIVPQTVSGVVLRRADALGRDARHVLDCASVLGRTFPIATLSEMVDEERTELVEALRRSEDALLLEASGIDHYRFRHALTRDAFLSAIPPGERRELARRGLDALTALTDNHDHVAAARLAVDAGEIDRAVELLHRAARDQVDRGGLRTGEETIRRAIELVSHDPRRRVELDELLLEILCLAGKTEEARTMGADLLVLLAGLEASPSRLAEVHLRLASNAVTAGSLKEAAGHAQAVQRLVAEGTLAARADLILAESALAQGDTLSATKLAEAAADVAEAESATEVLCAALDVGGRAVRSTDFERGRAIFERLLGRATLDGFPLWRARALMHLGALDMLTDGRLDRLQEASESAERIGAMGTAAEIEIQTVLILATQFRLEEALEIADRVAARSERYRLAARPMTIVLQGGINGWMGRRRDMERRVDEAMEMAGQDPVIAALCWGDLKGMCSIFEDDRDRALEEMERAMAFPPGYLTSPAPFRGMWALLRTIKGKDDALAREVVRETAAHGSWWVLAWLRYADAVAAGRSGRIQEADETTSIADRMIDEHVLGAWAKHVARRQIAEAALADGWGDPITWLKEATAFFEPIHPRIASSCRALLRREGVALPRKGRGSATVPEGLSEMGVTSREMDVLLLIMEGCSNRDIASRLYLSPRTIEKHVESLMQKAGADSRTRLAVLASKIVAP